MKRLRNHYIGIDQGEEILFQDFENGGPMWTGTGPRMSRRLVSYGEAFRSAPSVQVALTMWDFDEAKNARVDLKAENITKDGFEIVFRTWGDTRVARVRVGWTAMGELRDSDEWDLY
ncbi:MAG: H-type lectin domain-containing protein [Pseudomonadota bacterium]